MRKKLVAAVLAGKKTATASLRSLYEPFTTDPLPCAGERFFLAGYSDEPLGTIEVTDVRVVPLNEVDLKFAIDEGEGYSSIDEWREAGLTYWSKEDVTDETLIVCEWFRLI